MKLSLNGQELNEEFLFELSNKIFLYLWKKIIPKENEVVLSFLVESCIFINHLTNRKEIKIYVVSSISGKKEILSIEIDNITLLEYGAKEVKKSLYDNIVELLEQKYYVNINWIENECKLIDMFG